MSALAVGSHRGREVTVRSSVDGLVVRKRYPRGVADVVFAAMADLWLSPFGARRTSPGMPAPLRVLTDGLAVDMSFVDGPTLANRSEFDAVSGSIAPVAALLVDLHDSGARVTRRRTARKVAAACERAIGEPSEPAHATLSADVVAAAAHLDEVLVASHGDFGPHNVLMASTGPVLIDFDRVQMAGAGRDVQHFAAWMFAATTLAGEPSWDVGDRFELEYLRAAPGRRAEVQRTRGFHRATALVRVATSWSPVRDRPEAGAALLAEAARWLVD